MSGLSVSNGNLNDNGN